MTEEGGEEKREEEEEWAIKSYDPIFLRLDFPNPKKRSPDLFFLSLVARLGKNASVSHIVQCGT